eukprot:7331818-Pyramimonas_sp.AAC.2
MPAWPAFDWSAMRLCPRVGEGPLNERYLIEPGIAYCHRGSRTRIPDSACRPPRTLQVVAEGSVTFL